MGKTPGTGARNSLWRQGSLDKNASHRATELSLGASISVAGCLLRCPRHPPSGRACRGARAGPCRRGGWSPARSRHSLGATQLPSGKAGIQAQVGLAPNAMLPAAARGHLSRTQPGPQHFLHAQAGRGSKRPAGLDARQTHCTLADSPAPVIRHCTEMTQQSACPPKGTTAPRESLLRHGELGEVPHPERTARSILRPSNESPTGPPPLCQAPCPALGTKV